MKSEFKLGKCSAFRTELMGIATIGILLCHAVGRNVMMPKWLNYLLTVGNQGVDIFLFLSGLGIYYSLHKQEKYNYWCWIKRRLVRVLLPYLLISVPLFALSCYLKHQIFLDFLYRISFIGFWQKQAGDWFVALIIPLYVISPIIGKIIDKSKNRGVSTLLIMVLFFIVGNIGGTPDIKTVWGNIQFTTCRVPSFVLGYGLAPSIKSDKTIKMFIPICMIGMWAVLKFIPHLSDMNFDFLIAFGASVLFSNILSVFPKVNVKGFLTFFGKISLESYLSKFISHHTFSRVYDGGWFYR